MNRKLTLFLLLLISSVTVKAQITINQTITHAQNQTKLLLQQVDQAQTPVQPDLLLPRSLTPTNELKLIPTKDWTSGFFPGNLWFLYEHTHDPYWLNQAQSFTSLLAPEQFNTETHDVGFKIYSSYGTGYRLTQTASYRNVIIQAAKSLATRFNPKVGCIQSWNSSNKWPFPVIIDNMMNLELLFAATRLTGDSTFYRIADSHASTTLKNHFRADYSSWHVVDYDPLTGQVRQKNTHQGYSDQSAWARGQAWGLYGYTMCYRETKNQAYLTQAERIASFILNHPRLPADLVPYWDFDAPLIPNEPRDASAAAIMASALYELSTYSSQGTVYRAAADKILSSLANLYASPAGENRGFILQHSTGHKPAQSEMDVPLVYADYYYLEALLRKKETNITPQLSAISNRTITAGQNLSFTATTTDANANQVKTYSLVNAPAGATIDPVTGAFSWTPTQAGTFTFFVQVTDNGSPILSDVQPVTIIVTPLPTYTLTVTTIGSGTVTKSPNQASYPSGSTVTLTATPASGFQFTGWSNDAAGTTNPLTVSVTGNKTIVAQFTAVAGQQVASFNLMNAETNQPLGTITNNAVLNLANLPGNLNIQAITNPTAVGSVVFNLSGSQSTTRTETGAPYALFGDVNGNYNNWVPTPGNYTLRATPYTLGSGGGGAGTPLTINFSVVDQALALYSLNVSATNGTVTKSPNQTSYAAGTNVQLTANPTNGYKFSSWSGDVTGTNNPLPVSMTGNKNITANFTPVTTDQQLASFTLMNASTDQPIRNLVSGDVIDVSILKSLNIRANTNPSTVGSVVFNLSGTQSTSRTETGAPYALFGDSGGNYNSWTPTSGNYTLTATPYSAASGGGTAGIPLTIQFSVISGAASSALSQVTAYPTPTSNGHIQVNQKALWEGKIRYILRSATGNQIYTGEINLTEPTNTLKFDFSGQMAASGVYYLQLVADRQKSSLVLMRL
ncbi:InlB B-repeat-containing protein [Adhaeribacter arboris]|uniref:InlB B-repeat-containing protein n=1 Tax=Adhaeribacter arboris TaxID=2072846 RepID=UPI000D1356AF|nr:putative Ig domain-containing protein [Adhaeribacter arboris]